MPYQSTAAQAARMIRDHLKATGLQCRVTSNNFSMGDSVDVVIYDQTPEIVNLVQKYCAHYQTGYFDGMTDCYIISNLSSDLPQVMFVHVRNEISPAFRDRVYAWFRSYWNGAGTLPENYDEARNMVFNGDWVESLVHREIGYPESAYWRHVKARVESVE